MVLIAAIFPILGDDSDCLDPVFAPADAVSDPTKVRIFFESNALLPVFFERRRAGKGPICFVNESKYASGLEAK